MSNGAVPPDPDALRKLLGRVSLVATRILQWTKFLAQLRLVMSELDGFVRAVPASVYQDTPVLDPAAWPPLLTQADRVEMEHLAAFDELVVTYDAIVAVSPLPKAGGDLRPADILDTLKAQWAEVQKANGQGSAKLLKPACESIKRGSHVQLRRCVAQIQHESEGLTALVKQLEAYY